MPGRLSCIASLLVSAALLLGALAAAAPAAAAGVYWSNWGTIGHAGLDGSGVDNEFIPYAGQESNDVAVAGGHVYWADYRGGRIGRSLTDGSGIEASFIAGADRPESVSADGTYLYWTNTGADTIGRAKLDGSEVDQDFVAAARPLGLAVDDEHVYWSAGNFIGRAELDGSGVEPAFIDLTRHSGEEEFNEGPLGLAVDDSHLYWANQGEGAEFSIGRANLDGSGVQRRFVPLGFPPFDVAVGAGHLYWTGNPNQFGHHFVSRAELDGSGVVQYLVSNAEGAEGIAVEAGESRSLSVTVSGAGAGVVSSDPAGISCGSACAAEFEGGGTVVLAAVPGPGSNPAIWSGCDAIVGAGECEVTLSGSRSVTAWFEATANGLWCRGAAAAGAGSSLQGVVQAAWSYGFGAGICPGGPAVGFGAGSAGDALAAWDAEGLGGGIDTAVAFLGTDAAPTAAQIANVKAAAGPGVRLAVVPVAQTAVAVVANPPAGCAVEELGSTNLAAVFEGRARLWSDLASAEGDCGSPIVRVVPAGASAVAAQFKNYLFQMNRKPLACAPANGTWDTLRGAGTTWPLSCPEKALSALSRPDEAGDAAVAAMVAASAGTIGFAPLPEARAAGARTLALQNNGFAPAAEATYAAPAAGAAANCGEMTYKRPAGGGGLDLDWSAVFGAKPAIGSGAYPLCMLTYAVALHGYVAAGFPAPVQRTVRDYLSGYVLSTGGQELAGQLGFAPLPSSPTPQLDVLGEARRAAAKITS